MKGIKRKFSVARTPQQNEVAERKNRTLIEAARTMLADSLLPTTLWAEAVNTACYVQNRVLVTKPHKKTPYELLIGRLPNLEFMRPFGCLVTILNTLDHLGKFNGKADEGPECLFDIDSLIKSMNYEPVSAGNQSNGDAGIQTDIHVGQSSQEKAVVREYILLPLNTSNPSLSSTIQSSDVNVDDQPRDVNAGDQLRDVNVGDIQGDVKEMSRNDDSSDVNVDDQPRDVNAGDQLRDVNVGDIQGDVKEMSRNDDVYQGNEIRIDNITNAVNVASIIINTASNIIAAEADTNNLDSSKVFSPIPTTRVHKDHPKEQIIGGPNLNTQTRRIINFFEETLMMSSMGELTFFLGMQAKQKQDGIFISQDKYVAKILKKFGFSELKTASTPMETSKPLLKDVDRQEDLVWTVNLQLVDVNSLAVDLYPGSVKSRQWLQTPQLRLTMLLLRVVMDRHKETYVISSHTKKIFANIRRIGASFSRVITALFDTIMDQAPTDISNIPIETYQTPIVDQPSTSKHQKPQKPRRKQRKEAEVSIDESEDEDHVSIPSSDPLPSGEDSSILNKLMVFYTSLQEQRKLRSRGLRRLKRFGSGRRVKFPIEKDGLGAQEDASKKGRMIKEI
nr:retrovirus-related Pol polyprotein from transposon TNT 1-94 [Tanacetum cinerariifolium]